MILLQSQLSELKESTAKKEEESAQLKVQLQEKDLNLSTQSDSIKELKVEMKELAEAYNKSKYDNQSK